MKENLAQSYFPKSLYSFSCTISSSHQASFPLSPKSSNLTIPLKQKQFRSIVTSERILARFRHNNWLRKVAQFQNAGLNGIKLNWRISTSWALEQINEKCNFCVTVDLREAKNIASDSICFVVMLFDMLCFGFHWKTYKFREGKPEII